jgi:integrase
MARALTAKRIAKLCKIPGRYPDGEVAGLYLQITTPPSGRRPRGAASWVLRYERDGHERMFGIGSLSEFSLKEARSRAKAARQQLKDGIDPIDARKAAKAARALEAAKAVTFRQAAESYFEANRSKWRSALYAREWIRSLERHVYPTLGALAVSAIDTGLVLRVIEEPWKRIPQTAALVRQRIEAALDWATVRGYRSGDNPARWSGHIEHLLPPRKATDVRHFAALPYAEVPAFMADLRQREGVSERALEFLILTTSRSGEVLHATWDTKVELESGVWTVEVDLQSGIWTVPGTRMKGGRPHRVPLSPQAIALLEQLPDKSATGPVFTRSGGRALGRDSLERALARIRDDVTVHGFRSTFRDWASERTAFPHEVCERALAHVTGSKSSRAYARSDLLEERRRLMEQWAAFCYSPPAAGELVPLRKAARL